MDFYHQEIVWPAPKQDQAALNQQPMSFNQSQQQVQRPATPQPQQQNHNIKNSPSLGNEGVNSMYGLVFVGTFGSIFFIAAFLALVSASVAIALLILQAFSLDQREMKVFISICVHSATAIFLLLCFIHLACLPRRASARKISGAHPGVRFRVRAVQPEKSTRRRLIWVIVLGFIHLGVAIWLFINLWKSEGSCPFGISTQDCAEEILKAIVFYSCIAIAILLIAFPFITLVSLRRGREKVIAASSPPPLKK